MSRHTQYDDRASILLNQILATCYEISTQTKADAFFDYSPHISGIIISIHPNGWSEDDDYEDEDSCFFLKFDGDYQICFGDCEPEDDLLEPDDDYYKRGIEPLQKAYEQLEALKKQYIEEANNEKD